MWNLALTDHSVGHSRPETEVRGNGSCDTLSHNRPGGTEWPDLSLGARNIHSRINHLQRHDWPLPCNISNEYALDLSPVEKEG